MHSKLKSTEWIKTKSDFVEFMNLIVDDYNENGKSWENKNLQDFIAAMAVYSNDVDGFYKNDKLGNPEIPTWKIFADIIMGSRIYE